LLYGEGLLTCATADRQETLPHLQQRLPEALGKLIGIRSFGVVAGCHLRVGGVRQYNWGKDIQEITQ
jgi:hypothetical protein